MLSFSLNKEMSSLLQNSDDIWNMIQLDRKYFMAVHKGNYKNAMQDVWYYVVTHRDKSVPLEKLGGYIKKICRTIYMTRGDIPVSVYDEETGEVSSTFKSAVTPKVCEVKYENTEEGKALMSMFTDLYLTDSDKFMTFFNELSDCFNQQKQFKYTKKDTWCKNIIKIISSYPSDVVIGVMTAFKLQLSKNESKSRVGKSEKAILLQPYDSVIVTQLDDISITQGKKVSQINISTLRMQPEVDLDHKHWSVNCQNKGVVRICIDRYMDDIINNIYVEEGKNTHYIKWFNSSYKMTSPGGFMSDTNATRENFIEYCRKELICNLIPFINIVGVSDSYIYAIPDRKLNYKYIVLVGKHRTIKLEVEDVLNENL